MDCNELKTHLLDYLYDELPPLQRKAVENALSQCPDCAQELESLRQIIEQAEKLPQLDLSHQARSNIIREARLELDKMGDRSSWTQMFWQFFRSPAFATLAVTSLVLGVLWTLAEQGREKPRDPAVATATEELANENQEPITERELIAQSEEEEAGPENLQPVEEEANTPTLENDPELDTVAQIEPQLPPGVVAGDIEPRTGEIQEPQGRGSSQPPSRARSFTEERFEAEEDVPVQVEEETVAAAETQEAVDEPSFNLQGSASAGSAATEMERSQFLGNDPPSVPAKEPAEVDAVADEGGFGALADELSGDRAPAQEQAAVMEDDWDSAAGVAIPAAEEGEGAGFNFHGAAEEAPPVATRAGRTAPPAAEGLQDQPARRPDDLSRDVTGHSSAAFTLQYGEALSLHNRGAFAEALAAFRALLEDLPRQHEIYPDTLFYTGSALMSLNRHTEAISILTQLLNRSQHPNRSDEVRYMLGQAYELSGDKERAVLFYEELQGSDGHFQNRAEDALERMRQESP